MYKSKHKKAPICLFVFNKSHLINKILKSVSRCVGFSEHRLFIFSDNFKNYTDKKPVDKIRNILIKFSAKNKNVTLIFRNKNLGLKKNITFGINEIISKYKRVIVLEDDLILSRNFLLYMNSGLNFYKNDKKVFSINGYVPKLPKKLLRNYNYDNFLLYSTSSWGWGTWYDRWKIFKAKFKVDKDNIKKVKKIFSLAPNENYFSFLDINLRNKDLWAANWSYASLKDKKLNSFPTISKVSNIGFDGSGQGGFSKKYKMNINNNKTKKFKFIKKIFINENFNQIISNFYYQNFLIRLLKFYQPKLLKNFFKYIKKKLILFLLS
tara:strand:+ start:23417 stop:24382 length:966 start_codon:yes stop_codon:yes gene_type:complete